MDEQAVEDSSSPSPSNRISVGDVNKNENGGTAEADGSSPAAAASSEQSFPQHTGPSSPTNGNIVVVVEEEEEAPSDHLNTAPDDAASAATENPQDATIEPSTVDFAVTVHDESAHGTTTEDDNENIIIGNTAAAAALSPSNSREDPLLSPSLAGKQQKQLSTTSTDGRSSRRRRTKRGRAARIDDSSSVAGAGGEGRVSKSTTPSPYPRVVRQRGLSLPSNQYETVLIRRAIRKQEDAPNDLVVGDEQKTDDVDASLSQQADNLEVYGDTSLGMKLCVVSAKVIVQSLNALSDGRASPAQLAGLIKRGDVLLSVNGASLLNLPIDQLMSRLGPLSSPDANGVYQRRLLLRFEAGGGLSLLPDDSKHGGASNRQHVGGDLASDVLSLFPMVDQLSGAPLFEETKVTTPPPPVPVTPAVTKPEDTTRNLRPLDQKRSTNERISVSLAAVKRKDRDEALSEFFTWSKEQSKLMRCEISIASTPSVQSADKILTKEEFVERGQRAILGAGALARQVETVDSGKDVRSFRSWNTTLSLYSRASTRRRVVLDAVSLPVNFGKLGQEKSGGGSDVASGGSGSGSEGSEHLDGDELLLRLAAQDEIWRKQVIEYLNGIADGSLQVPEEMVEEQPVPEESHATNIFSNFLLGENISKILTQRKKTQALPPSDVTAVLFDLTTKLCASVPDEIAAGGIDVSTRSTVVPFSVKRIPAPGSQVMLATQFLVDEALPAWVKTFKPLPWEQRRLIWPLAKHTYSGSTATSTISDDSLTIDSFNTGPSAATGTASTRKRRNLREQIEDQELDAETKGETCFLLTYYFVQALLPRSRQKEVKSIKEIKDFIKRFGAYLKLHTCLAYSAAARVESVIDTLLELAKHDPKHRETIKQTSRSSTWLFYEPTMLSAVMQRLKLLKQEGSPEMRQATIDLCASAYPDVQPWQVQIQCRPASGSDKETNMLSDLYYSYLSLLLHPLDGHESARRNIDLVNDWCELSVEKLEYGSGKKPMEFKSNFLAVASRASSTHKAYQRDLVRLLKLSMQIDETDLVLDIAGEILDDPILSGNQEALNEVLESLRSIGRISLSSLASSGARTLIRILKLFRRAAQSRSNTVRETFNAPQELLSFIESVSSEKTVGTCFSPEQLEFIQFLAESAEPEQLLQALACFSSMSGYLKEVLPIVQTLLRRAAHESGSSELSVALMKVKHARMDIEDKIESKGALSEEKTLGSTDATIWRNMSNGMITIAK